MRGYVLAAMAVGLLFASDDQKQDSSGELGQLTILEKQVLEAWKTKNLGTLQSLLRDDYVEIVGPGPARMTKVEVLKVLAEIRITDYALDDVKLVRVNRDAAILTYKLALKGVPDEKASFATPAYVSSVWVHQDASWLSVFRQWTPLSKEEGGPQRITAFEAVLTPNSVRYLYKGTTQLENIQLTLEINLSDGRVSSQTYWGTWQPREVKEISLAFVAFGASSVQRIDLSGTATLGGKKVLLSATSRRDANIPVDWKSIPPILKLP